jgi:hypothetical protein
VGASLRLKRVSGIEPTSTGTATGFSTASIDSLTWATAGEGSGAFSVAGISSTEDDAATTGALSVASLGFAAAANGLSAPSLPGERNGLSEIRGAASVATSTSTARSMSPGDVGSSCTDDCTARGAVSPDSSFAAF